MPRNYKPPSIKTLKAKTRKAINTAKKLISMGVPRSNFSQELLKLVDAEKKKNPSIKKLEKWTKVKAVRVVKGMLQILK